MTDFYHDTSQQTASQLKRAMQYVELAIQNGDAAHLEGSYGTKVVIELLKQKGKSDGSDSQ